MLVSFGRDLLLGQCGVPALLRNARWIVNLPLEKLHVEPRNALVIPIHPQRTYCDFEKPPVMAPNPKL